MPSFDVVSEVKMFEVTNAVDQANRELVKRFDFKNTNSAFTLEGNQVAMRAPDEFHVKQMLDILMERLVSRKIDIRCLKADPPQVSLHETRQIVTIRQGIEIELARKIVKMIKNEKIKVQAAIQGDKVRVSGKKKDELQQVIAMLKDSDIEMPLQFENYRD